MESDAVITTTILTSLSTLVCLTVSASYRLFPELLDKSMHKLLCNFSFANLLLSVALIPIPAFFPMPCVIQGVIANTAALSSCGWCLIICFAVYELQEGRQLSMHSSTTYMCWCFPFILSMLPFTNRMTYKESNGACVLISLDKESSETLWLWVSLYAWLLLSFILGGYIYLRIIFTPHSKISKSMKIIRSKLFMYFPILIACWMVPIVYDGILRGMGLFSNSRSRNLPIALLGPSAQGILVSIVFWLNMDGIRTKFSTLFQSEIDEKHNPRNNRKKKKKITIYQLRKLQQKINGKQKNLSNMRNGLLGSFALKNSAVANKQQGHDSRTINPGMIGLLEDRDRHHEQNSYFINMNEKLHSDNSNVDNIRTNHYDRVEHIQDDWKLFGLHDYESVIDDKDHGCMVLDSPVIRQSDSQHQNDSGKTPHTDRLEIITIS